jgi:tetratricopeptide (TPR) repeat protein
MQTGQVFVSHTSDMAEFPDGRSFVQAALDAVGRAEMASVDMRYFAARDGRPAEYCRQRVRECEVYVAVVGFRYGSVVPGEGISYTELEFAAAGAAGRPRLVFLLEDPAGLPAGLADADPRAVDGFRGRLRDAGLVVRGFGSPGGLELEVFHALTELTGGPAAARASSARPAPATMMTLPRDVAAFTGRDAELDRLVAAATSAGGLMAIHAVDGMPGVGKTALVTRAAHLLAADFPDGQLFVGLHAHTSGMAPADPAEVLAGLLACTGMKPREIPAGLEARAERWRGRLAGQRVLLVLDDAAGQAQVEPLLPGAAGCLVLVTSRRRLIALPGAQPLALDTLFPAEAAELLIRLSGRIPDSPDAAAAADLAVLCGHLPLAIAMLAGRLAHHSGWSIRALADDFAAARHRLASLTAGDWPGDPSVTAAFDMSYEALPVAGQRLFRLLGLHPGTEIDAHAAAALAGVPVGEARAGLDALFDNHLIDEPAPGRYRLHDLLREYARALAVGHDTATGRSGATGMLLDYYQYTARAADIHLTRPPRRQPPAVPPAATVDLPSRAAALAWMRAERANLLACIGYADGHGQPRRVIALTAAMAAFLDQEGPWNQAADLHAAAAVAARGLDDRPGEAGALCDLGRTRGRTGDYQAAADLLKQALAILDILGDRLGAASALSELGRVRAVTGDCVAAVELQERALAICRDLGDRPGAAHALWELGRVHYATGDYPDAADLQQQALAVFRGLGDRPGEARVLHDLGRVRAATGDFPAAARLQQEALFILRGLGDRPGEASALHDLGSVRAVTGHYLVAARLLERALANFEDLGDRLGEAGARWDLGRVRTVTGDYVAAAGLLEQALSRYRDLGSRAGEANARHALGRVHTLTGDYLAAAGHLEQSLSLYRDLRHPSGEASALSELGRVRTMTKDYSAAASLLERSVCLFREAGDPQGEAEALNATGALLAESAGRQQALAAYLRALELARQVRSPLDEARALEGVARCASDRGAACAALSQAVAIYQRIGAAEAAPAGRYLAALEDETEPGDPVQQHGAGPDPAA